MITMRASILLSLLFRNALRTIDIDSTHYPLIIYRDVILYIGKFGNCMFISMKNCQDILRAPSI